MTAKRKAQLVQYADKILSMLNLVERMRYEACSGQDFSVRSGMAVNIWRTAQAIENAVVLENKLPDIRGLLEEINDISAECYGNTGAQYGVHSYMRNAIAMWKICRFIRTKITPEIHLLLDMIAVDGYTWEYTSECYPTEEMTGENGGRKECS